MFGYFSSLVTGTTIIGGISGSIIGMGLLSQIGSLTFNKTCDVVGNLTSVNYPSFEELLKYIDENDVVARIQKIQYLIESYNTEDTNNIKNKNKIVQMSLDDLKLIIDKINDTIKDIKIKKEYQDNLYFSNWSIRKYDCTELLYQLKYQIGIFDIRFNDFTKIIQL